MPLGRSRNALIGFAMVFVTLLANALLSYLNVRRLYVVQQSIAQTHEVLLQLDGLLTTLTNAEIGQRTYLLSGDASHLEAYRRATVSAEAQLKAIERLIAHQPHHGVTTTLLAEEVRLALGSMGGGIAASPPERANGPPAQSASEVRTAMDRVREVIRGMQAEARSGLARQAAESKESFWTALITASIAAGLGFALGAVAYVLVERDMQTRAQAAAELQAANERLEDRVRERTAAISEANAALRDEIEVRQQAEQQANRFADELQRSNRELAQFASVASHDLQEPLRKIVAFGERLRLTQRDQLGEQGQEYLDRMQVAAGRMRRLIDDLLHYARVADRHQPAVTVDLYEVANEVVGDLDSRIHQCGGRVEIGPLPKVSADPSQMRQLLQNLIVNGLKFHRSGVPPVVVVSGRLKTGNGKELQTGGQGLECELVVSDNGIGFPQEDGERIFELFQRLHGQDAYEGTGMGLAICKKVVERHEGQIAAYSSPGQGARFVVVLPVEQDAGSGAPP
jgi:signal transduction histidine kinase